MPLRISDIVVRSRLLSFLLTAALAFAALLPAATPAAAATQVCVLACDTLDPSQARQETFPVPNKDLNGRRLELHVSDADDMAWASIDSGVTGDSVWLDRSWDGGTTWEGLLGKASIPSTWTGTRTLMYNITDPRNHRRGLVRACGDAAGVGCTNWVYPTVCDTLCDSTGAGQAAGDDQPVPSTTLYGRTIRLHVDQKNSMAWASIDTGGAGDEIWLDRSWDGGSTWPDGSSSAAPAPRPGPPAPVPPCTPPETRAASSTAARSAPAAGRRATTRAAAPRGSGPCRPGRARRRTR